jgi:hypothetical protein
MMKPRCSNPIETRRTRPRGAAGLGALSILGITLLVQGAAWADPGASPGDGQAGVEGAITDTRSEEAADAREPAGQAASDGVVLDIPSAGRDPGEYRPPYTPRWGTMIGEAILLFGTQELIYWTLMKPENVVDFDYGLDWRSFRSRFLSFDGWMLDNNMYDTNALRHPAQGMANYLFARSNTLTVPSSYLFSFVLSSTWELVGEFRELVSINDMVMTPATAMPIAEAFAQMGAFFGFYDWLDRARPRWMRNLGAVWLDGPIWHDFRLVMAGGVHDHGAGAEPTSNIGLDTEIIRIAGYGQPGTASHLMMNGNFSQLALRSSFGERGLDDFLFFARAALLTYYRKSIAEDGASGYELIVGASSAFEYGMHWVTPGHDHTSTRDQTAIAHLVGPTIDGRLHAGEVDLRAVVDVYGDFAMVRNYALGKLRAAEGDDSMKSSVLREDYHYALGVTAMGRAIASYRRLEAGLQLQHDLFDSIEGLDRHQDRIMVDYDLDDSRTIARAWLTYELPVGYGATSARIGLTATDRRRAGTAGMYTDANHEREYMGGLVLGF